MGNEFSLEDGKELVNLAREAISMWVKKGEVLKPEIQEKFTENKGVFVTILSWPEKELRGCIGHPQADKPLAEGLVSAAAQACQDPRMTPVAEEELDKIIIEVSILTDPELIRVGNPKDYLKEIVPGKDGLVLEIGGHAGLFLPSVWEHLPKKEDFLHHLCMKAGVTPDRWMDPNAKIYRFYTQVFAEREPNGEIITI